MRRTLDIILALVCLASVSCIKNDVPYPYTPLSVISVTGDGFTTASINSLTRTVTISLEEATDIQSVTIDNVAYSEETTSVVYSRDIASALDMSYPLKLSLKVYDQSYLWSIEAQQSIARTVSAVGQIGESTIDVDNRIAYITISNTQDPSKITLTALKLAADGATYSPEMSALTDFSGGVKTVSVTSHERTETWRLRASFEEATVNMSLCTLLATIAWVETTGDTSSGEECGYKYRKNGDAEWETYVVENSESGKFSATITGLTPNTAYEIRSYIGDSESELWEGTTEDTPQLDNSDFEVWDTYISTYNQWTIPYIFGDETQVWDSGNQGAASGGSTLTQATTDIRPGSTGVRAAELDAQGVGLLSFTKFAAGNIFTGNYAGTNNTDGLIAFGYPFTQRPIALKGWYKYTCGVIDYKGSSLPADISANIESGVTPDIGTIYIALGTWTPESYTVSSTLYPANSKSPIYVYTADTSSFFDPTGEDVVAYGSLQKSESVLDWTEFYIPLDYYDRTTIPTHILIVASTSLYGDYFTGSTGSLMFLDDFELVYE